MPNLNIMHRIKLFTISAIYKRFCCLCTSFKIWVQKLLTFSSLELEQITQAPNFNFQKRLNKTLLISFESMKAYHYLVRNTFLLYGVIHSANLKFHLISLPSWHTRPLNQVFLLWSYMKKVIPENWVYLGSAKVLTTSIQLVCGDWHQNICHFVIGSNENRGSCLDLTEVTTSAEAYHTWGSPLKSLVGFARQWKYEISQVNV